MRGSRRRSFIVRVIHEAPGRRFVVHDLRSGEVREFARWEELRRYLERCRGRRLR
jgi:hypothetical protein